MSVEEKLKKFQFVCEDKIRKIELLKISYEKNEQTLKAFTKTHIDQATIAELNFKIAKTQLHIVNIEEDSRKEAEYQDKLVSKSGEYEKRLDEIQEAMTEQTREIQNMKIRLDQRQGELNELCCSLRETVGMGAEEARTLSCCIHEATLRSQADQQVEWMGRLLRATKVQTQDAQRKLDFLQDHDRKQPQYQPPLPPSRVRQHRGNQQQQYPNNSGYTTHSQTSRAWRGYH